MQDRLRGIFPPIPTSFDASGNVDVGAMRANTVRWMATGLAGVLVLGSNGEANSLTEDEGDQILGAVRLDVPSTKLLIAGTGRESTRLTIDACRRAATLGADAVLVRPPSYYKAQMTPAALIAHFQAVADASPIPVLLYNLPVTGVTITVPVVTALAPHGNIVGMKETSVELERLGQAAAVSRTFSVLSGSAPVIYPALVSGAVGGILAIANVLPDSCVALYEHVRAGRHDEALALQRAITPLAQLVTSIHGVPGLKHALDLIGFHGGPARSPLMALSAAASQDIARGLEPFARMTHAASR